MTDRRNKNDGAGPSRNTVSTESDSESERGVRRGLSERVLITDPRPLQRTSLPTVKGKRMVTKNTRSKSALGKPEKELVLSPLMDLSRSATQPHFTAKKHSVDVPSQFEEHSSYEEPAGCSTTAERVSAEFYRNRCYSEDDTISSTSLRSSMTPTNYTARSGSSEGRDWSFIVNVHEDGFPRVTGSPYLLAFPEPRRMSDPQITTMEDYQSYDYRNAARMQDAPEVRLRRGIPCCCCRKKKARSVGMRCVPLPFSVEEIAFRQDSVVCRICHETEEVEPLIQPCLCRGTVGNVHVKCLERWLEQSNTNRCELCNYPYAIRQTLRYSKCNSIKIFLKSVIDRRTLVYDCISFAVITPIFLGGLSWFARAAVLSSEKLQNTEVNMGNVTRVGMAMLTITLAIAYFIWFYTVVAYHYKTWKKWYENCYDVEVIPIHMTSAERLEAYQRVEHENRRRAASIRRRGSGLHSLLRGSNTHPYTYYRQMSLRASPLNMPHR